MSRFFICSPRQYLYPIGLLEGNDGNCSNWWLNVFARHWCTNWHHSQSGADTLNYIYYYLRLARELFDRSLHTDSFPLSHSTMGSIAESVCVCVSAPITRAPTRLLDGVLVFPAPVNWLRLSACLFVHHAARTVIKVNKYVYTLAPRFMTAH